MRNVPANIRAKLRKDAHKRAEQRLAIVLSGDVQRPSSYRTARCRAVDSLPTQSPTLARQSHVPAFGFGHKAMRAGLVRNV